MFNSELQAPQKYFLARQAPHLKTDQIVDS